MHPLRKLRRFVLIFSAGAAAAYYLDPENGPLRRSRVLDQLRELVPERDVLSVTPTPPVSGDIGVAFDSAAEALDDGEPTLPPLRESAESATGA